MPERISYDLGGITNPFNNQYTVTGGNQGMQGLAGGSSVSTNTGGGFMKAIQSLNSKGSWGTMAGDALSSLGSMIGNKRGEDFSDSQKATQSMIRQGLAMIPGYGQIIAATTGALDAIGTITGTNLSNIDKNSASRAGIGFGAGFNNAINHLPGVSALAGGFGLWSGRTDDYELSKEAEEMQSGYSGTIGDLRAAGDIAGKRMIFQRGKANDYIASASKNDAILRQINQTNTMRKQSDYYQDLNHQNANRYAGQNYLGVTVGREGLKLMSIEDVRKIILSKHGPDKLQNGGVVGVDQSVLPTGALHKELHHIEDVNPELAEEITRKGIPVVTVDEEGNVQQVAEVEREELILSKSITDEIERLRKIGDDNAMIECGKLVSMELIENTQDNTGQITEEVENGK